MTVRRRRKQPTVDGYRAPGRVAALVVCVVVGSLAACGPSKKPTGAGSRGPRSTGGHVPRVDLPASQIVLQVRRGGGRVPTESLLGGVASLTVYRDGRVFTPDPHGPSRPGDLIRFRVGRVDQRVIDELIGRFERSHLFSGAKVDFGDPRVMDAPTTSVRLHGYGAAPVEVFAYALSTNFNHDVQGAPRRRRDVLSRLLASADTATKTEARQPYSPERVLVYELADSGTSTAESSVAHWPGPDLARLFAAGPHRVSWTCALVQGRSVAPIVAAAERRSSGTLWRWNGRIHRLVLRTLLPGEPGCGR